MSLSPDSDSDKSCTQKETHSDQHTIPCDLMERPVKLQTDELVVVGAEVVGLYPNLDQEETAEAVRQETVDSTNFFEAGKYIATTCDPMETRQMGVDRLIPQRRFRKGPKPSITREGALSKHSDDQTQLVRTRKEFTKQEQAKIMPAL